MAQAKVLSKGAVTCTDTGLEKKEQGSLPSPAWKHLPFGWGRRNMLTASREQGSARLHPECKVTSPRLCLERCPSMLSRYEYPLVIPLTVCV